MQVVLQREPGCCFMRTSGGPLTGAVSYALLRSCRTIFLLLTCCAFACAQSDHDLHSYADAVSKLQAQNDFTALENFVSSAPDGALRSDALEWLAWREWRAGLFSKAAHWSDELLAGNSRNPVGMAVQALSNRAGTSSGAQNAGAPESLTAAQEAIRGLNSVRPPYAMPAATFASMKDDLAAGLSGVIGYAYYERRDPHSPTSGSTL